MTKKKPKKPVIGELIFKKENYLIFFVGVAIIILGFILMALGGTNSPVSLTVAPIVLLIGFLVVIPAAIMYRKKSSDGKPNP